MLGQWGPFEPFALRVCVEFEPGGTCPGPRVIVEGRQGSCFVGMAQACAFLWAEGFRVGVRVRIQRLPTLWNSCFRMLVLPSFPVCRSEEGSAGNRLHGRGVRTGQE